jgi:transcription elongation factor SPT6
VQQVAKTMAEAAYKEKAQQNGGEIDEDLLQMAVEHVLTNPSVLDTLTIADYALHTQDLEQYKKISTLELIKSELQHGFQEWRQPYVEATEEDYFFLLSGENEDTLFPGLIVHATVKKVQQYRVMCVLESGILGFIQKEDLSDDGDIEPKDKVAEGNIVTCRVKDVVKEKYLVNLTCR